MRKSRPFPSFIAWFYSQCQSYTVEVKNPGAWFADIMRLYNRYEDAIFGAMIACSENPALPLTEIEVFAGFIMNKTGAPTSRQQDRSIKLHDEFTRISAWITKEMRRIPTTTSTTEHPGQNGVQSNDHATHAPELDALELCLACIMVGCKSQNAGDGEQHRRSRKSIRDLESFRIVAAAALTRELNAFQEGAKDAHNS